jgi:DNA primase catalytic core
MGRLRTQVLLLICTLMLRAGARRVLQPLRARATISARTVGVRAAANFANDRGGNGGESFAKLVRRSLPPLSEVFSDLDIHVERRGGGALARCPFHKGGNERNPSMSIDDSKGVYYCFTCKASGNAMTLVQELEGLSYPEAIGELAERYGVEGADRFEAALLSQPDSVWGAKPLPPEQQALVEANEAAARYYVAVRKTRAAEACALLLRDRGVTNAIAERFSLGFAPDDWGALAAHLRTSTNVTAEASVAAGLCMRTERGGVADRLRGRLIIPIHDATGRLVGLGGRTIVDDPKSAKYINSPESPIFTKRQLLYGMHLARGAIRKAGRALIVEGYMDAIALHAAGLPYAVACLGTALSEQQLELAAAPLAPVPSVGQAGSPRPDGRGLGARAPAPAAVPSRTVVLALDADEAGQEATWRLYESGVLPRLASRGIDVRVATMPKGFKDPDEFVQAARKARGGQPLYARGGAGAAAAAMASAGRDFEEQVVERASSWVEWVGRRMIQPYLAADRASGRLAEVVGKLVGLLKQTPMRAERSLHASTFAAILAAGDAELKSRLTRDIDETLRASSLPVSSLAPLGVAVADLYVWNGAPNTLHWSSTSTCKHPAQSPRAPRPDEMALPLCPICAAAQKRQQASDATLARPASAPTVAAASRAAASPPPPAATTPTTTGGAAGAPAPPPSAPPARGLQQTDGRTQAELLMIHVLLQSLSLRKRAAQLCATKQLWLFEGESEDEVKGEDVGEGEGARVPGGARLSTPARRAMLRVLLDPPSMDSADGIWEELGEELEGGVAVARRDDALLLSLRRQNDDVQYLSAQWAAGIGKGTDARARLLDACVNYIVADERRESLAAKAESARVELDSLRAALSAMGASPPGSPPGVASGDAHTALKEAAASLFKSSAQLLEQMHSVEPVAGDAARPDDANGGGGSGVP